MNHVTAKPYILKQANLSLIRSVIKARGTATRAEIAEDTGISSTTVRSLLTEMIKMGEIESIGYDKSSGGRKAERYRFQPEQFHCAAFCISGNQIHALLIDLYGNISEVSVLEAVEENYEQVILTFLDNLTAELEIKAIGVGVPGIVEKGSYWKKSLDSEELHRVDIGKTLSEKYGVPVVLENDLNATAIGIGRCCENELPEEKPGHMNMAYLHFDKGCISAGFIVDGRIVRGCNNFAGELGLIPVGGEKLLDAYLAEPMGETAYVQVITNILSWICGILNPQYIALGGPALPRECIGSISSLLSSLLPPKMTADILYSEDTWHDYHNGMAYLTAGKMFDTVQVIKE